MKFCDLLALLGDTGNQFALLTTGRSRRKIVCAPGLVGRVMSSTFDADQGDALGWIGIDAILKGPVNPVFNNYGGEERLWFGPEGGQFGLHFTRWPQTLANYRVPRAGSAEPYHLVQQALTDSSIVMSAGLEMTNLTGTTFRLEVRRSVHMLESSPYTLGASGVECVGFQSGTQITNIGDSAIRQETGLLCCWTLGQFPNADGTFVVLPFNPGPVRRMGKAIRDDYVQHLCPGKVFPSDRWSLGNDRAVLRSDGQFRVKVAMSPKRSLGRLGSVDFAAGQVLINDFDVYPELPYVSPYWRRQSGKKILDGEALSCYIDGPDENGQRAGDCYELETLSPALPLQPGETFFHRNRITHMRGPQLAIEQIAQRFLHTSCSDIAVAFARPPQAALEDCETTFEI